MYVFLMHSSRRRLMYRYSNDHKYGGDDVGSVVD